MYTQQFNNLPITANSLPINLKIKPNVAISESQLAYSISRDIFVNGLANRLTLSLQKVCGTCYNCNIAILNITVFKLEKITNADMLTVINTVSKFGQIVQ